MSLQHFTTKAMLLAAAIGLLASTGHATQPQQAPDLKLTYDSGASTCLFHTDNGVSVSGSLPQTVEASGTFDPSCNIGGGGNTGPASVSVTAGQSTLNVGDSTTINWAINGDVCRYDGSSLPEPVTGWKTSGYACTTAGTCNNGNLYHTFNTSGVYTFRMTCNSGVNDSKVSTATVTVGTPPPSGNCVAPTGLTRDSTGTIATSSGFNSETVDVTKWRGVYGHRPASPDLQWPGYFNRDVKVTINRDHYWALEFTVGANYPYYGGGYNGSVGPYGTWTSNSSNVTTGVRWTLSLSEDCGDFPTTAELDAMPSYKRVCYQEYRSTTAQKLLWLVAQTGQYPAPNSCTLRRGKTYYLNILPAPLGDPLNNSENGCNQPTCKGNFLTSGNYNNGDPL